MYQIPSSRLTFILMLFVYCYKEVLNFNVVKFSYFFYGLCFFFVHCFKYLSLLWGYKIFSHLSFLFNFICCCLILRTSTRNRFLCMISERDLILPFLSYLDSQLCLLHLLNKLSPLIDDMLVTHQVFIYVSVCL